MGTQVKSNSLFTAGNVEQFSILGLAPVPRQSVNSEGTIELLPVYLLRFAQGSIDVE